MAAIKGANLALRFLLELGALVAIGYWAYGLASARALRLGLAVALPLAVALLWGALLAPNAAVALPGALRAILGLAVLLLAAAALAAAGRPGLGVAFALVAVVNAALMALWRQ